MFHNIVMSYNFTIPDFPSPPRSLPGFNPWRFPRCFPSFPPLTNETSAKKSKDSRHGPMKGGSDIPRIVIASQVGSEAVLHEVHHVDFGLTGEPIEVGPEFTGYLLSEQPPVYPGDPLCEERWVDPTKLYDRSPNKPQHNRPVCVSLAPLPVRLKGKGTAMIRMTDPHSFVVEDLDDRSLFGLSFGLDGLPSSNGLEKAP